MQTRLKHFRTVRHTSLSDDVVKPIKQQLQQKQQEQQRRQPQPQQTKKTTDSEKTKSVSAVRRSGRIAKTQPSIFDSFQKQKKPIAPKEEHVIPSPKEEAPASPKRTRALSDAQEKPAEKKPCVEKDEKGENGSVVDAPTEPSTVPAAEEDRQSQGPSEQIQSLEKDATASPGPIQSHPVTETPENDETPLNKSDDTSSNAQQNQVESLKVESHESKLAQDTSATFQSNQQLIEAEKRVLCKFRVSLDITLTFHAAQKRPVNFHAVLPTLRMQVQRNVTQSHLAKVIYLAADFYILEPFEHKERQTVIETYIVEIGKKWKLPMNGKDMHDREAYLNMRLDYFFDTHKQAVSVPEAELPKHRKKITREEWLATAPLPEGVRQILKRQEEKKNKTDEPQAEQPPPTGTVKERGSALLARIRAKAAKKS